MKGFLSAALCLMGLCASAHNAHWITASQGNADAPGTWIAYQHRVKLDQRPKSLTLDIAADSKYWLWVNGQIIVWEGGLKRGPGPDQTYYDHVDIAPALRKGDNRIAVLVCHFGKSGFSHIDSGRAGLCVDAQDDRFDSSNKWLSRIHPAYGLCGDPQPNYRLSEPNVRYNGQQELTTWQTTDGQEMGFLPAREIGRWGDMPWGQLVLRPTPQWKDCGTHKVKYTCHPGATADTLRAQLPGNIQYTPVIDITADQAGLLVSMYSDHLQGGGEYTIRGEYQTRQGRQQHESLCWVNGEEMIVIVPHGIRVHSLAYHETSYNTEASGRFQCDDDFYTRFWNKGLATLRVNMRDTFFDCPDRERAQWWGDCTVLMGESFYTYDTQVHHLMRKAILELCDWQRDDKCLRSPIPGTHTAELPAQMLASVGLYGFWNYYMNTGDLQTIRHAYPHVQDYLSVWHIEPETGLTAERHGGWDWGDWGENRDIRLLYAGWHYIALDAAARMAEALGRPQSEAEGYRAQMERVRHGFQLCWDGEAFRHPLYRDATDDRVQALAVVSGIATPEQYPAITRFLGHTRHASPYMEKYIMEALFLMGEGEMAMQRTRERFTPMVDNPNYSTLFEGWGIGSEGYGGGTTNHAWSGGAITVISQYLMGLYPTQPGWKEFDIRPQFVTFHQASISVPTVAGTVSVAYKQKGGKLVADVTVPRGTRAHFVLPATATRSGIDTWLAPGYHRVNISTK